MGIYLSFLWAALLFPCLYALCWLGSPVNEGFSIKGRDWDFISPPGLLGEEPACVVSDKLYSCQKTQTANLCVLQLETPDRFAIRWSCLDCIPLINMSSAPPQVLQDSLQSCKLQDNYSCYLARLLSHC